MDPAGYGVLLLCGPLAAIAAVWLADRIGVPYPVLLVALGAILAWLPWVNVPTLAPEVVFYLFLPPLLYYAAYFIAPDDLRASARPIGLLSVGLVLVTTAVVAGVLVGIAGVPLVVALVAGAVVAPTDAVAATSVFARLDVPERLATIVEGEGLTNDGTALVLYTGAVGTAMVGAIRPGPLVGDTARRPGGRRRAGPGRRLARSAGTAAHRQLAVGDHPLVGDAVPHLRARRRCPCVRGAGDGGRRRLHGFAPQCHLRPRCAITGLRLSRCSGVPPERRVVHVGRHGTRAVVALDPGHTRGAGCQR